MTTLNWVDIVILVLLAAAAVRGWWTGAARQVFSFGGLFLGLVLGVTLGPSVAGFVSPAARALVVIAFAVVVVICLGSVGEFAGLRFATVLRRVHLGVVDELLGVAVAVVAMLLVVWFVGNLASSSRDASLDRGLRDSLILRDVSRSLPTVPSVFSRIESLLSSRGFPLVFANLPPQLLSPVAQPTSAAVRATREAAGPSTVKVIGPACNAIAEGSGFVAAPHIVVTNAHVVAGDPHPQVVDATGSHSATPIWFDAKLDVAVLLVPGLTAPPLAVDTSTVARGTQAVALGFPGGGGLTAVPAAVDGAFLATGFDISGKSVVTRDIYQLHAAIRPGNSGGPLVVSGPDARSSGGSTPVVIGLVFARSTTDAAVGYALGMAPVARDVHKAEISRTAVSTGACVG